VKFNTFGMKTRANRRENEGDSRTRGGGYRERGYCGGVADADGWARREAGCERERESAERHITNAIPDPHGSARIALLFGFN